jgi:CDGSH-type Zn-finger protein
MATKPTRANSIQLDRSHVAPVKTREELIYLLSRASELEHGLACIYLFASHSLKNGAPEGGLSDAEAEIVRGWKRKLAKVAVEEMLHLAQVSNMLTAIGGAPHFKRTNFPLPPSAFPFGLRLSLEPFSQQLIERFVCYEMPEEGVLTAEQTAIYQPIRDRIVALECGDGAASTQDGGAPIGCTSFDATVETYEPFDIDFKTVGEFYHKIETGFLMIPEAELFIGPREAQASGLLLDLAGELVEVVDRASACSAIDMIIEQGEAPSSAHPDAHFILFDNIRREYAELCERAKTENRIFAPVRPVISNPMTRFYDDTSGGIVIADPLTHEVADLFNVAYDTMLLILLRFFAHTDETDAEFQMLSRAALRLMTSVLRPLGEALTKMPVGRERFAGMMAGPGFGYNRDVHLLPHKYSTWVFLGERLRNLALVATRLRSNAGVPSELREAASALEALAVQFAPTDRAWNASAEVIQFKLVDAKQTRAIEPELDGPYLVTNVSNLVNSRGEPIRAEPEMALCRCGGSANKPFCDGTHARIGFSSHKRPDRVPDRRDDYVGAGVTIHDNRGICQHAGFCTDNLSKVFRLRQEPWIEPNGATVEAIINQVRQCPSGALSCSVNGVAFRDQQREPTITVSKDGPYRVTGGIELKDQSWGEGASREHCTLCRCGGSRNKPFCDGTHWYNKFTDPKN